MENAQFPVFDVSAALRRGQVLLKDREWDDAIGLYNQILMSYPENADAYVGLMLAKNKSASLGELTQVWPGLYREEPSVLLNDALTDAQRAAAPGFDGRYPSRVSAAQANRERMEKHIDEDKNFRHAQEYGDDTLRAGLARIRAAVLAAYDSRIESARREEEMNRQQVLERLSGWGTQQRQTAAQQQYAVIRQAAAQSAPGAGASTPPANAQPAPPAAPRPVSRPADREISPKQDNAKLRKTLKTTLFLSLTAAIIIVLGILIGNLLTQGKRAGANMPGTATEATVPTEIIETVPDTTKQQRSNPRGWGG